jgi:hypothetical protein
MGSPPLISSTAVENSVPVITLMYDSRNFCNVRRKTVLKENFRLGYELLFRQKGKQPMATIDINAVLNFAGGLFGFAAVVVTVFVQFWRRTHATLRSYFLHVILILVALGVGASAIVAKFVWESRVATTLFDLYIILLGWEFLSAMGRSFQWKSPFSSSVSLSPSS